MASFLIQHRVVGTFSCLGAECPDTCCAGWNMPVDAVQLARYRTEAPELLATVDLAQGIMKKDAPVGSCNQLCEGLCAIQNKYGSDFLGDSCHFYPRIVHAIGGKQVMVGSTSCPEMLRLMVTEDAPFTREEVTLARMPGVRRDILPEGATQEQVLAVMDEFLHIAADDARSPESIIGSIIDIICEGMDAGAAKATGAHAIYYALALTEAFTNEPRRERLNAVMQVMEQRLGADFSRATRMLDLAPDAANKLAQLNAGWHRDARVTAAPLLRRWIQAQLAMTAFPFGGLSGLSAFEHMAVLVQRFATMRLALMCHVTADGTLEMATALRVVQVLSRFMDHLADAKLTQMIFRDMGWNTPAQLHQLIR
jgi:hypothetical protein